MLLGIKIKITVLLLACGLLPALARGDSAHGRRLVTREQFAEISGRDQRQELQRIFREPVPDEETASTLLRLLSGPLGTTKGGCSCLTLVIVMIGKVAQPARALRLLGLLLDAAKERGQLSQLLGITSGTGKNVFHYIDYSGTDAHLRSVLAALGRLGPCAADCAPCAATRRAVSEGLPEGVPADIGGILVTFLPARGPAGCAPASSTSKNRNIVERR